MSCTASPGMSRGSANTIALAISSEGIATTSRRARYRLNTRGSPRGASAIQPGGHQPTAVVVAEVRAVVLERAVRQRRVHRPDRRRVVHLLRQITLSVVNQLA